MLNRIVTTALLAGLVVGGATASAQAQQPISSGQQDATPSGWTFNVAPYGWIATVGSALKFDLPGPAGGTVTAASQFGFGDILSHLNFATMIAADAQYDRFSVLTDFMYLNLGHTASHFRAVTFPGQSPVSISGMAQTHVGLNLDTKIWTLAGGYTVAQGDWGNFDAIAGFRYLGIGARADYSLGVTITGPAGNGATFGGNGNVSGSGGIWNGIGGFRGRLLFDNSKFFVPYYFDIGTGGSNLTWQISSGIGYKMPWADLSLTYRYLSFEDGSSGLIQHLWVRGPMIMANFSF